MSDTDREVSNYFDIINSFSLLPHIILSTRVTSSSSTLIDNIFCNSSDGNIISCISDHFPQFLLLKNFEHTTSIDNDRSIRNWKVFNENVFLNNIRNINWNDNMQIEMHDVNYAFDMLINTVDGLLDEHAPYRKMTKKNIRRTKSNPWISNDILISINKRDLLYKRYIKETYPVTKALLHEKFKLYRNKITSLCRLSKSNFCNKYFRDNANNIGKVWKGIKSIISIKYSESSSPTCLNIDNCPVTDPSIISNSFNEYFASIAAKIREKIPEASKHFSSFLKNPVPNLVFLSPTDALEVSNCISSLNLSKSSGPHGIPPKILSLTYQQRNFYSFINSY